MSGKDLRLKRFIASHDGRTVLFPLDHGVTCGPVPGLECLENAIRAGVLGGADGLVLHKGMLPYLEPVRERLPGRLHAPFRKHPARDLPFSQGARGDGRRSAPARSRRGFGCT